MKQTIVFETDLFPILLKLLGSEPHARIAANIIYWLQFAEKRLRGRVGVFKEDKELEACTGKKNAGRLLFHLSRVPSATGSLKTMPRRLRPTEPLFEIDYGPKPNQHSGRVRWIFATEVSNKIRQEALANRQQKSGIGKAKMTKPVSTKCADHSPQNAPTLLSQTNHSIIQSAILSIQKSKESNQATVAEKVSEELRRNFRIWNMVCDKSGKGHLKWRSAELLRFCDRLAEVIEVLQIETWSDEVLEKRMNLLCNRLEEAGGHLSDKFKEFNKNGLTVGGFAMYGQELMAQAAAMRKEEDELVKMKNKASDVFKKMLDKDMTLPTD